MTKKTKKVETPAVRFGKRLQKIAGERGLNPESIARLSPRLKFHTVESWWHGQRLPRPEAMVDLARALKIAPSELIMGCGMDMRTVTEVDLIAAAAGV